MNYYQYTDPVYSSYYQLDSEDYDIKIRQQPKDALLAIDGKEKNRKPVDPPPIIEVNVRHDADPVRQYLQSPYLFMCASLVPAEVDVEALDTEDQHLEKGLCGTAVSSLHRLKDIDNKDGGFFVFGDLSVKRQGEHRLRFSLFELRRHDASVIFLKSILSNVFTVYPSKEWPGLDESTHLSRTFADQGVRLRLRKEARTISGATSGSKRSFSNYAQSTSQTRPSTQATAQPSPSSYSLSQSLSSTYSTYGEQPAVKRQRSDEGSQQYGYTSGGPAGPSSSYQRQVQIPQMPLQSQGYAQTPTIASRWPQSYGQGPSSAPTGQSDFTYGTPYAPRQDTLASLQQYGGTMTPSFPQTGYQRAGQTMYTPQRNTTPQQAGPSPVYASSIGSSAPMTPHTYHDPRGSSTLITPVSNASGLAIPAPGTYQAPPLQFPGSSNRSQYNFPHAPQYRDEPSYSSLTGGIPTSEALQGQSLPSSMTALPARPVQDEQGNLYHTEGQLLPHLGGMPQGYPGNYPGQGRPGYQS